MSVEQKGHRMHNLSRWAVFSLLSMFAFAAPEHSSGTSTSQQLNNQIPIECPTGPGEITKSIEYVAGEQLVLDEIGTVKQDGGIEVSGGPDVQIGPTNTSSTILTKINEATGKKELVSVKFIDVVPDVLHQVDHVVITVSCSNLNKP